MNNSYKNYQLDDVFMRTFMMPAVELNQMNMPNKQPSMNNMTQSLFTSPSEGFLRGNMEANSYIPYKNMTYARPVINNEKEAMIYKLQEMSFAAHDLNLYLDTHPNDTNTIRLYNEYNKQSEMLNNQYERKYGPIDLSDNEGLSVTPWAWIKEPWPWNE